MNLLYPSRRAVLGALLLGPLLGAWATRAHGSVSGHAMHTAQSPEGRIANGEPPVW